MFHNCVIYTSINVPNCLSCKKAKRLMADYGIAYKEVMIGRDITKEEFNRLFGPDVNTVPQITIDGARIGGYESLSERLRGR